MFYKFNVALNRNMRIFFLKERLYLSECAHYSYTNEYTCCAKRVKLFLQTQIILIFRRYRVVENIIYFIQYVVDPLIIVLTKCSLKTVTSNTFFYIIVQESFVKYFSRFSIKRLKSKLTRQYTIDQKNTITNLYMILF